MKETPAPLIKYIPTPEEEQEIRKQAYYLSQHREECGCRSCTGKSPEELAINDFTLATRSVLLRHGIEEF